MSRVLTRQVTGVGVSLPIVLTTFPDNFVVGVGTTVSGTGTYSVEFAFDDQAASGFVATVSAATCSGTWFSLSGISGSAVNANALHLIPSTLMRLNVLAASAGFTVTVNAYQGGPAV